MDGPKQDWDFTRLIRLFTKDEVKTPLSYMFKISAYLTAAWFATLYAPLGDELKYTVIQFIAYTFGILCLAVLLFAWFRPTHLVYGESGHRAERKMEFGTEQKVITELELDTLRAVHNKQPPLIEGK
jgi:hypothetical protein